MLELLFAGAWGPLLVFCLRIFDVSFTTLRILLSVRNARWVVPVLAFFEVSIWLTAAGHAMAHLTNPIYVLGYTTGYATGTWVGLWLEQKLAFGWASLQVVSRVPGSQLSERLRERGVGVMELAGKSSAGRVEVLQAILKRRELPAILALVERCDPDAFVMVEQPHIARRGWLLAPTPAPARGQVTELRQAYRAPRVPETEIASLA